MQRPGPQTATAVICVFWSSSNTFIYCFFGHLTTEILLKINEWLYNSNWHDLQNEHQQFYIMLIANSQRPLYFHGFGIANLTLENYAKVFMDFKSRT